MGGRYLDGCGWKGSLERQLETPEVGRGMAKKRAKKKAAKSAGNGANLGFEAKLWLWKHSVIPGST